MNGMRQVRLVAAREIRERGRSRAFLISFVLMLVAVVGAVTLPVLLDTGAGTKEVGLTGSVPAELAAAMQAQGEGVGTTIRIHHFDTVAAGEEAVRDAAVDVLVVNGRKLEWQQRADEQLKAVVTGAIQSVAVRERAAAAGMSPDELAAMAAPMPVDNVELGQVAGRSPDDETAAFVMTLVLFGAITTYGAMVLSGVVEEKSSRTVEVLLARMPARNLLAGKIAGIGLLGLAQVTAAALAALGAGTVVDGVDIPAIRGSVIAWAVVWFVLGYALYATVFGVLGSLASRTEDASSVTGPVTVVLVLGFMVSFAAIGSADTTWAQLVSWFPLTAPLAMPNRIAMGAATWWDPAVAVVLTLAVIAALVVLGGRIYTRAILHTGAMLSLGEAWRGTRVPAPSVGDTPEGRPATGATAVEASAPETTTTNEPLTRLVLIGLAVLLGGAVFALAQDFVIGVAAGAAFYALARGVVKAREHADR
ncbi:MAG TPA: ABC transporter permease [Jiangellaceae bacterium]